MRYYIRRHRQHLSGPHDVADIRQWIKESKVREEMEFSVDGRDWHWGIEVFELFPSGLKTR